MHLSVFSPSIKLSPNAERYLNENREKPLPFAVHSLFVEKNKCETKANLVNISFLIRSSRLAIVVNNRICILSLLTSDELLSIIFDENSFDQFNHLNCLSWSNNGKFLAFAHWSGLVSVYSSIDGQLIHELSSKSVIIRSFFHRRES